MTASIRRRTPIQQLPARDRSAVTDHVPGAIVGAAERPRKRPHDTGPPCPAAAPEQPSHL
jgi:hypothetical protein